MNAYSYYPDNFMEVEVGRASNTGHSFPVLVRSIKFLGFIG